MTTNKLPAIVGTLKKGERAIVLRSEAAMVKKAMKAQGYHCIIHNSLKSSATTEIEVLWKQ